VKIVTDRADHHFARVEPNADLYFDSVQAAHLFIVPADRFLHPERGVTCTHGMVLMGQRCSEQRHDTVTHHLIYRPFVAVNGLHHVFKDRIEELPRLLGVPVGQQFHRSLEVSEQYSNLLALAFQGTLGSQYLLREMLRSVRLRRGETIGSLNGDRRPAGATELLAGGDLGLTPLAGECQASATVFAEFQSIAVLRLTPGTFHAVDSTGWR
jgi:hypothetical protein